MGVLNLLKCNYNGSLLTCIPWWWYRIFNFWYPTSVGPIQISLVHFAYYDRLQLLLAGTGGFSRHKTFQSHFGPHSELSPNHCSLQILFLNLYSSVFFILYKRMNNNVILQIQHSVQRGLKVPASKWSPHLERISPPEIALYQSQHCFQVPAKVWQTSLSGVKKVWYKE